MRARAMRSFGIHQQRGFWLRCFLGSVCLAIAVLAMGATGQAQVAAPAPYHLAHLRGVFVDYKGNPIQGAEVTLDQDDNVKYTTKTDRAGRFEIKHVVGRYRLHVEMTGYAPVDRQLVVGLEAVTYLHGSTLYLIAGPGACTDDCSKVFTSKGEFDHALRGSAGR